jgi:hypothetical protein
MNKSKVKGYALWLDVFENEVYMFSYKEKKFIKINQDSYEQLYQEANEGGA